MLRPGIGRCNTPCENVIPARHLPIADVAQDVGPRLSSRAVRPPPLPHQVGVLHRILERIAEMNEQGTSTPTVVFDLDGTLFDNRPRTLQILMEYADEMRGQYPDVAHALSSLDLERVQYLLSDTLRACGLTHADIVRDATTYWRDRFFSDDYMAHDEPLEGAVEYARACHDAGAIIVYLTGRDIPGMFLGTVASLRDHGFPVGLAGVELVLKPDATLPDEAFKRSALPTLSRVGEIVGFFDNEPANCNLALHNVVGCYSVLLDTQSVPGAPEVESGIEIISDFRLG